MDDSKMIEELRRMARIKAMTFETMKGLGQFMLPMEAMLVERQPALRERIESMHEESTNAIQIEAGVLSIVADKLEGGEAIENVLIKRVVKMAKSEDKAVEAITSEIEDMYEDDYENEDEYEDEKMEKESDVESTREDAAFLREVIKRARETQ